LIKIDELREKSYGIKTLKKIPAFILIASFICSRNPESSDVKIFKGGV